MHRMKKLTRGVFSLLIAMLLLIPGGLISSLAAEEGITAGSEVEIPIPEKTSVHDMSGNKIGELETPKDGESAYYRDTTEKNIKKLEPVTVYAVTDEDSPQYYNRLENRQEGRLLVVLRSLPAAQPVSAEADGDESLPRTETDTAENPVTPASNTPSLAINEQPAWIDAQWVLDGIAAAIAAATPTPVSTPEPTPTPTPTPTKDETRTPASSETTISAERPSATPTVSADKSSGLKEPLSAWNTVQWAVIVIMVLILLAVCAVVVIVLRNLSQLKKNVQGVVKKQSAMDAKLQDVADRMPILDRVSDEWSYRLRQLNEISEGVEKLLRPQPQPQPKQTSEQTPEQTPEKELPPPQSPEEIAIATAESLFGVIQMHSWTDILENNRFSYQLIMPAASREPDTYRPADNTMSMLACIWASDGRGDYYVIPSWNDASAFDPYWRNFYDIQGPQQRHYEKLAKVSRFGDFVRLSAKGCMFK